MCRSESHAGHKLVSTLYGTSLQVPCTRTGPCIGKLIAHKLAQPKSRYGTAGQPNCVFGQMTNLTGHWVSSSSRSFHGFYNASSSCPDYINEFDCQNPEYFVRGQPTGEERSALRLPLVMHGCMQGLLEELVLTACPLSSLVLSAF